FNMNAFPVSSFDESHASRNFLDGLVRFGLRSTGEYAGFCVGTHTSGSTCSARRSWHLPIVSAISVAQVKIVGFRIALSAGRSAFGCQPPLYGSRTVGQPPSRDRPDTGARPAGTFVTCSS